MPLNNLPSNSVSGSASGGESSPTLLVAKNGSNSSASNKMLATGQLPNFPVTSTGVDQEVLNIANGSGYLLFAAAYSTNAVAYSKTSKITIDGVEVLNNTTTNVMCTDVGFTDGDSTNDVGGLTYAKVPFNKSLLIEINAANTSVSYAYDYYLT